LYTGYTCKKRKDILLQQVVCVKILLCRSQKREGEIELEIKRKGEIERKWGEREGWRKR
jgi:hypothetical protein